MNNQETNSRVYKQLLKTKEYADKNEMQINFKTTKLMLFNPCTSIDFVPQITLDNHELEVVEEMRLLGVIIRSDLKWHSNTENIVSRATNKIVDSKAV